MKCRLVAPGLLAVVCLPLLLGGCSGAGVPAAQVRGASIQAIAADHLSGMLLVKSWFKILHRRQPSGDCVPEFHFEFLPDFSMHLWGKTSDCITFDYIQYMDGSGCGTQTRPDGKTSAICWGPRVIEGSRITRHIEQTLWGGERLEYDLVIDPSTPGAPQTWDGSATLPDGRTMLFVLNRTGSVRSAEASPGLIPGEDHLTLALPDGSQLEVRVPHLPVLGTSFWPVFADGATGTFRPAGGGQLGFTITGQGDRWDRWEFTSAGATAGVFTLGADFDGAGLLTKDGSVVAALRWLATGDGTLEPVVAASVEVAPSATARDFQVDQWISSITRLGPAPTS